MKYLSRSTLKILLGSHFYRQAAYSMAQFNTINFTTDKSGGSVKIPGFGYEDVVISQDLVSFKPRMWRTMCLVDHAKERMISEGFLDLRRLEQTHYSYIMCASWERLVPFETVECKGTKPYAFPMDVYTSLAAMGKSSFQIVSQIMDMDQKDLFTYSVVYVCVERKTLKVEPIPDWFVEKYGPGCGSSRLRVEPLVKPTEIFSHPILVSTLDLDYYNHTNNTAYAKFAADAISGAFRKDVLGLSIAEDDAQAKVKKITQLFLQDSKAGERLTGDVWTEDNKINCIIKNEEGKDLYHHSLILESKHILTGNL